MSMSTKERIVSYLKFSPYWVSGSELERQASEWRTKSSVISRRCRELAHDGTIQRRLWEHGAVQYKAKEG
jgi:hypothetical protein